MFQALDASQSPENFHMTKKRPEEVFNSTQMSFGKEIEQMHKQIQDEMQNRINELEILLKQKEVELNESYEKYDNKF